MKISGHALLDGHVIKHHILDCTLGMRAIQVTAHTCCPNEASDRGSDQDRNGDHAEDEQDDRQHLQSAFRRCLGALSQTIAFIRAFTATLRAGIYGNTSLATLIDRVMQAL